MRGCNLPIFQKDKIFKFSALTGSLFELESLVCQNHKSHPSKTKKALELNDNPYLLPSNKEIEKYKQVNAISLKKFASRLTKVTSTSFFLGKLFTKLGRRNFENSVQAIAYYRSLNFNKPQKELCLSRSLFAASTSKKFKEKGVMFIGVFLPTKSMHAWIIEDGVQPDPQDDAWINFQPVAAFYFNEQLLK